MVSAELSLETKFAASFLKLPLTLWCTVLSHDGAHNPLPCALIFASSHLHLRRAAVHPSTRRRPIAGVLSSVWLRRRLTPSKNISPGSIALMMVLFLNEPSSSTASPAALRPRQTA